MTNQYLLDTGTILWAQATPERLPRKVRRIVESGSSVLSVASYWEVMVKVRKGLLEVGDPVSWWRRTERELSAEVLPVRSGHIDALGSLPEHHKDPFDRILIAQAIAEGLTIVTGDETLHRYPVKACW
jgi:PIN domain nuclease of toxin-antitoxin system